MHRWFHRSLLALAALALVSTSATAGHSKLDALARIAVIKARTGQHDFPTDRFKSTNDAGDLDVFITGDVTRAQLEALGVRVRAQAGDVFTAFVPVSAIDAVAALSSVRGIQGSAPVELENDNGTTSTGVTALRGPGPAFVGANGAGVLVGDVDSGVDYNHPDFLDNGGQTRFVSIWDQTVNGVFPAGYAYGTEWLPAALNANTATQTDVSGHGTHVLGSAAGDGSGTGGAFAAHTFAGMAPMADLLMVKTNFQTTGVFDGVAYAFGRATALGKNAVVNLSLGSHFGPKDGTSPFESGLSALCGPGRIIVKSAGNERSQSRHAEVFAAGAGTNVTMTVTGSANGRILAFDGYYEASEEMNVRITTPNGTVLGPITLGGMTAAFPGTSTGNGNVYLENGVALTATGDKQVYIEIAGTATGNMNGTWTFTFIPVITGAANGEVDLWRFFNSTGAAGNFVIGNLNEELISEPGNAVELITTAAWTSRQTWVCCNGTVSQFSGTPAVGNIAPFSSNGPTRDGRQKPEIAAPGLAIISTRSFDVAGTCPASGASTLIGDGLNHTANSGTSMAAPHTTGACAVLMQKRGALTPAQIKSYLASHAIVDGFTGAVWNNSFGNGKLHLGDLIDPTVAVVAPNGGESFLAFTPVNLQWTATDASGIPSVDLLLSRDGGATWSPIATGQPNTGSYVWNATLPASNQCRLRVVATDGNGNTGADDSDADWSIVDPVTSTELNMLAAEPIDGGVEVRWALADAAANSSSRLQRATSQDGAYEPVAGVPSLEGDVMKQTDLTVEAGLTYWYRVTATVNGREAMFGPIAVRTGEAITALAIGRITPNPSPGAMRVEFALPREADVELAVVDVQGREIARLVDGVHAAGRYQAQWNGHTSRGPASPGLYFVRLRSGGQDLKARLVLAR